ncbi:MAG: (2Fe-2S)-binding protein [Epsilonproteobacteria bacterium]|jgi:ferredoxin|uniref:Ferredoxin n=1 Tax=Sulfurospirillum cavolei TaxID=366522 RepID=A0A2D3WJ66_9BACT|nr:MULTISPECIES: 2Fe-2S iron-sulfur cluster-binding protein [Sulfurospirillum]NCB54515.1 (2Fe-2S)-binding protein [Campylobacterota bacterium]KHG33496.1 MAG: ferredoxin [Sulfurospirillum sp. MES]MCD8543897.1 (2Fe-2S)-binding protein [Sulfurospirillum cavolei]MCP3651437.1 (2Fe-2S)-binding protein [Sulfurospirillum sp. DNRA8]MCR1810284.1 (2Fe-2S)-binding protein [Sulfurospirillum sp. DNRA8]
MTTRVEIVNDFLAVNVKPGATIQDVVEASGSALPFGCRDGQCGTCAVEIVQGMEFLSPKTDKEIKVLKEILASTCTPNTRLSCQMKIEKPNGVVRIKY